MARLSNWKPLTSSAIGSTMWQVIPHAVVWVVWRERNLRVFEGVTLGIEQLINQIKECVWSCLADVKCVGGSASGQCDLQLEPNC